MKKSKNKIRSFSFQFKSRSTQRYLGKTRVTYRQDIDTREVRIQVQRYLLSPEIIPNGPGQIVRIYKGLYVYYDTMSFLPESLDTIMLGLQQGINGMNKEFNLEPSIFDLPLTTENKLEYENYIKV